MSIFADFMLYITKKFAKLTEEKLLLQTFLQTKLQSFHIAFFTERNLKLKF